MLRSALNVRRAPEVIEDGSDPARDVKDTVLVRDLANPDDPPTMRQVSAFLPLSDGRCELVVVGKPDTTGVR